MSYGPEIFRHKYKETMDSLNIIKDNYFDLDNEYQKVIKEKDEKIERLNQIIEIKNNRIQQLMKRTRSARINKAIKYIEENRTIVDERDSDLLYWLNDDFDEQKIINILKGEDNE